MIKDTPGKKNIRAQKPKTIWHPSFYASIKLELNDYREHLEYINEINLNKAPRRIDVLVIVLHGDIIIEKNIARIFKNHNLFEYKSPDDPLEINDYYNGLSYALQYKSIDAHNISIDELTFSFVCFKKPEKLLSHLTGRYVVKNDQKGIYTIEGNPVPVQIIVNGELEPGENLFLSSLRQQIDADTFIQILREINKLPAETSKNYIEALIFANPLRYMEVMNMDLFKQTLKKMSKKEQQKLYEIGERLFVEMEFHKKWEGAVEDERRAKEDALKKERRAKEDERRAKEDERRAKEDERRAKEEIKILQERIKQLELNIHQ